MKKAFVGLALAITLLVPSTALAGGRGGSGDDVLYGTSASEDFYGGSGNDVIFTGGGVDSVFGGPGFDVCYVSAKDLVSGCEVTR